MPAEIRETSKHQLAGRYAPLLSPSFAAETCSETCSIVSPMETARQNCGSKGNNWDVSARKLQ